MRVVDAQVEGQIRVAQKVNEGHRDKLKQEQQGLQTLSEALELLRSSNSQGKQELADIGLADQQARYGLKVPCPRLQQAW